MSPEFAFLFPAGYLSPLLLIGDLASMQFSAKDWYYFKTVLFLICVCLLVYFNSLTSPFQFDGVNFIQNNPYVKSFPIFFEQFKIYRLLQRSILVFTYTANYELGGADTFGYHLINVCIHFGVCLLIYLIARKIFRHLISNNRVQRHHYVPLLPALLFATHPMHTQAITYLMGRSASLVTFFYLGAFYSFMIFLDKRFFMTPCFSRNLQMIRQGCLIMLLMVLGIGTKMNFISLPLVMIFYFLLVFSSDAESWKDILWKEYKILLSIGAVFVAFLIYKAFFTRHGLFDISGIPGSLNASWNYLFSQIKWVIFYYLKLLLFPLNLNVDPDVRAIESLGDPKFILAAVIFVLMVFKVRTRSQWILFGLIWFVFTMGPESSLVPLQDVVADHRMYLSSIGLVLIAPLLLHRHRYIVLFYCIAILYSANLINRNEDWRSETSLWTDTVAKSPEKARPYINLARAYHLDDNLKDAILNYKKAAARDTGYFIIHHNLGILYKDIGKCDLAEEELRLALILEPKSLVSMIGLAECFSKRGEYRWAIKYLEKALKARPKTEDIRRYAKEHQLDEEDALTAGMKDMKSLASAHRALGKIYYFHLDQKERGKNYFRQALAFDPTHSQNAILKNIIGN